MIWIVIAAFALLTFIAGWRLVGLPQGRLARWAAVVGFVAAILGWGVVLTEMLSLPKAKSIEWRVGETELISSLIHQDVAIFLWVMFPEADEPRAYWLPYSDEAKAELEQAMADAEATGEGVMVDFVGLEAFASYMALEEGREAMTADPSLEDREPIFYAAPQKANPPKPQAESKKPVINFGGDP